MTRRVRFTPLLRGGAFAAAALLATGAVHATDVPFTTQPPVSTAADGARAVFAADVDGDGDTDLLSASLLDNKVAWYDNTAGNGSAWTIRTITTGAPATSVFAADVDGDGDMDVLSSSFADNKIAWYENTAGNGTAWTTRTISTAAGGYAVVAADVDGDGDLDVICSSIEVVWFENTAGDGSAWTTFTISTGSVSPLDSFAVDVDGDGDVDVLQAFFLEAAWYENTAGNGSAWTLHGIGTGLVALRSVSAADVDGDGDADALSASDTAVVWHENTAGNGSSWTARSITTGISAGQSVLTADVDGDGDPDALSASSNDDTIAWYRNDTIHESACFAPGAPVAPMDSTAEGVASADVDGDGDADVVVALSQYDQVAWYENTAGNGTAWGPHTIATAISLALAVAPADVDGDGDMDTFSIGYYSGLRWHRNEGGSGASWTGIPVGATGLAMAAADVDGDGDVDAIGSMNFFDPLVKWYENTAGDGSAWSFRTIFMATLSGPAFGVAAADLDGDGDVDVVSTTGGAGPFPAVLWFENTAGNGTAWTPHTVSLDDARSLAAADVDGDGDQDLVGGGLWYENANGSGTVWTPHAVSAADLAAAAADLDGDGDVDIPHAGSGVSWSENTNGNGTAWADHVLVAPANPGRGVAVGDFNGDGERDVLASTNFVDVLWLQHQGGQFSLAGADVSPGAAANGDLVPMLRIVATHLGRAGDGDVELASLGLLFEETAGDPLSSAEANALVENLHVYRDANGNGAFDPGADTLVITIPTLALVNGVETVTFADGDPNLQLSLGTPRTYFVVTELTGNASGQTPDQFQVTHLGTGASASAAEDRTYDIPLRPACPTDVTASLGSITPVELLGFSVE